MKVDSSIKPSSTTNSLLKILRNRKKFNLFIFSPKSIKCGIQNLIPILIRFQKLFKRSCFRFQFIWIHINQLLSKTFWITTIRKELWFKKLLIKEHETAATLLQRKEILKNKRSSQLFRISLVFLKVLLNSFKRNKKLALML